MVASKNNSVEDYDFSPHRKNIFVIKNMEHIGNLMKASDHLLCTL